MPRCPIVTPESVRLPLSRGEYLDVKKELNTGEHRQMIAEQFKDMGPTDAGALTVALNKLGMNRVLAYVLGWSFVGLDHKPLKFGEGALNSCDFGTWEEILKAVDAHHASVEKELETRKNGLGGESTSPAISPSPSAVTGESSGSVN